MTAEERLEILRGFRFTDRQARFLSLVMRHAGVCVPRQFATFAGIPNGGSRCNAFFAKLVRRGFASVTNCVHNRARLYHLHSKRLYYAIGEPNSRYRRAVPVRLGMERLMLLDAVLDSPHLNWLSTDVEKASLVPALGSVKMPGTFPIGVEPDGRVVLLYLATEPWTEAFRYFLQGHAALLQALPAWTLRMVFPKALAWAYEPYQMVLREELATPIHRITVGELKWYFEHRRKAATESLHSMTLGFLRKGAEVFAGPRFRLLHRRWLAHGDAVLDGLSSPVIAEALAAGTAREECLVLEHSYKHLSPLVERSHSISDEPKRGLRTRPKRGPTAPHAVNPPPQPPSSVPQRSEMSQSGRDWYRLTDWYNSQKNAGLTPRS